MAAASSLDNIIAELSSSMRPRLRLRTGGFTILPRERTGFSAALDAIDSGYLVRLGGWHETSDDLTAALRLLTLGLTDTSRLRVESRGGREYAWALECRQGAAGWREMGEISVLCFRFWQRRQVHYRRNSWPAECLGPLVGLLPQTALRRGGALPSASRGV